MSPRNLSHKGDRISTYKNIYHRYIFYFNFIYMFSFCYLKWVFFYIYMCLFIICRKLMYQFVNMAMNIRSWCHNENTNPDKDSSESLCLFRTQSALSRTFSAHVLEDWLPLVGFQGLFMTPLFPSFDERVVTGSSLFLNMLSLSSSQFINFYVISLIILIRNGDL